MYVSVAEARSRLSSWLNRVQDQPVTITKRGKPVGVIIAPEEYARLRKVQAYLEMLRIARSLQDSSLTAEALFHASRQELEERS